MIRKFLLLIGFACLGLYIFFTFQAWVHQVELESQLYRPRVAAAAVKLGLKEGDLFGRLEIPRLNMSVMVMEGVSSGTLRLGAGHIPGTVMAIAAHRDSFFRPLEMIRKNDTIRFTTLDGSTEYGVVSMKIVGPNDTQVLETEPRDSITLITCYPFYYFGPAPKRFIVQAAKN
jgi:sortase A